MSVFEPKCSSSRLPKSKKAEFTDVIKHFFYEGNDEIGHYEQTLNSGNNQPTLVE